MCVDDQARCVWVTAVCYPEGELQCVHRQFIEEVCYVVDGYFNTML